MMRSVFFTTTAKEILPVTWLESCSYNRASLFTLHVGLDLPADLAVSQSCTTSLLPAGSQAKGAFLIHLRNNISETLKPNESHLGNMMTPDIDYLVTMHLSEVEYIGQQLVVLLQLIGVCVYQVFT